MGWSQGRGGLGAGSIKHVLACQWSGTWGNLLLFCFLVIISCKTPCCGGRDQLLAWTHIPQAPGGGILLLVGQVDWPSAASLEVISERLRAALLWLGTARSSCLPEHTTHLRSGCLHQVRHVRGQAACSAFAPPAVVTRCPTL